MLELGEESKAEHQNILELAKSLGYENLITVGNYFKEVNPESAFANTAELTEYLKTNKITSKNILLKGSRGVALEKIIDFL